MDNQDRVPSESVGSAPLNPNRRRFASAGVKASGVILTLASTPALGCVCKSPSGFMSGNLSKHGTQTVLCNGLSPGYWKNHTSAWPRGCYPVATKYRKATTFASVFPFGATDLYCTGSMLDVINCNDPGQDPYNLGMHLVAAYLNVVSNKINFLSVDSLKAIWHDLYAYGTYSPTAGIKWGAKEVAAYLQSTEN